MINDDIMVFFVCSWYGPLRAVPVHAHSIWYNSLTSRTRAHSMLIETVRSFPYVYFFFGAGFAAGGGATAAALDGAFGASVFAAPPIMSRKLSPFLLCFVSVPNLGRKFLC
jgi:hypothetical protein